MMLCPAATAKDGSQRGIYGSEARHIITPQWYRELFVKNESLKENIGQLLQQQEQAKQELSKTKSEVSRKKVKNIAAEAGSNLIEGIGLVIGTSKVKKQQHEIESLKAENPEIK